jgi:hypothetical protein
MKTIFSLMPNFLRDPDRFFESIHKNEDTNKKAADLAVLAVFCFMAYGFTTGLAKSPLQAASSSIKMAMLFLSTMVFCLPALYFFSLTLLRTPLRMMQVLVVILSGISVSGFLLLGLAPITLFFVLTSSNYEFFQLLAVAFVGVSASIGVYFLWRGMTLIGREDGTAQGLGHRILTLWVLLYGFVGTQMTWRLSPFIGKPEDPFYLVKPSRDNFYVDVAHAIQGTLNIPASGIDWIGPLILGGSCIAGIILMAVAGGAIQKNVRRRPQATTATPSDTAK